MVIKSFIRARGLTLIELLVVLAIIAVVFALGLSAIHSVRKSSERVKCLNNIRQIVQSLHHHHDTIGFLPFGHRSPKLLGNLPYTGWPLAVLPFLEQESVYSISLVDFQKNRDPFFGHSGLTRVLNIFLCPSDSRATVPHIANRSQMLAAFTCYQGCSGLNCKSGDGLLVGDKKFRLADALDGTGNTILLGERPVSHDFDFSWWYAGFGQDGHGSLDQIMGVCEFNLLPIIQNSKCGPGSYSFGEASGVNDPCGQFHFWSLHQAGGHFGFADGSVRFMPYTSNRILPALASRAGGEPPIY